MFCTSGPHAGTFCARPPNLSPSRSREGSIKPSLLPSLAVESLCHDSWLFPGTVSLSKNCFCFFATGRDDWKAVQHAITKCRCLARHYSCGRCATEKEQGKPHAPQLGLAPKTGGEKSSAIVRFVFILPHNVLRFSAPPPRHVALKGRNGARCHPSSGGSRGKNLRLGRGHGFCIPWEATHDSQLFFVSPHLLSFLSRLLAFSTKQVARCPLLRCALPCHLLAYGSGCHDCFHEIRIPSLGNTSA